MNICLHALATAFVLVFSVGFIPSSEMNSAETFGKALGTDKADHRGYEL